MTITVHDTAPNTYYQWAQVEPTNIFRCPSVHIRVEWHQGYSQGGPQEDATIKANALQVAKVIDEAGAMLAVVRGLLKLRAPELLTDRERGELINQAVELLARIDEEATIDRALIAQALEKAQAYKQCGRDQEAAQWGRRLIELLELHDILR